MESDVYENAREVLETGRPKLLSYGIADEEAWSVGLPCGGEIDVFVERVLLSELERLVEESAPVKLLVFGAVDIAEYRARKRGHG